MQPLLDVINRQSSTLILYPQSVDVSNIIVSILTMRQITGKPVVLMVSDPQSVSQASPNKLPDELFIPYADSDLLRAVLAMSGTVAYIFIDNISLFRLAQLGEIFASRSPDSHTVLFATWSVTSDDINYLRTLFPDMTTLRLNFLDEGPTIDYNLQVSLMTPQQSQLFEQRRQRELELMASGTGNQQFEAENYIHSMQIGNFLYPPDIQQLLDIPRPQRPTVPPDRDVANGGWMTAKVMERLNQMSPKLMRLLTYISLHVQEKHVIYTRYVHHHGVQLISTLLHYLNIPHITITGVDKRPARLDKIKQFNTTPVNQTHVLLTSVLPLADIFNIRHIHFVEGIQLVVYRAFLDYTFKLKLYTEPSDMLSIHVYVAQTSQGTDAADAVFYRKFSATIREQSLVYQELVEQARPIVFDPEIGFAVE